jgi:hypothetical protein
VALHVVEFMFLGGFEFFSFMFSLRRTKLVETPPVPPAPASVSDAVDSQRRFNRFWPHCQHQLSLDKSRFRAGTLAE